MASRARITVRRALIVGASVGAACLVAEGLLRWVFHAAPLLDLNIYSLDGAGNLRMQAGAARRHVTRHWDVRIHINQEGFRDREPAVRSTAAPVMGLGDSFAFGWGVNLEESYLYRLEERLNQRRAIRVVKTGTPGAGPGDQLRLLETIWDRYRPQLVILGFFVGNDFADVQMGGLEQFEVENGLLIKRELRAISGVARWRRRLARWSHLLQFLRASQLRWQQRGAARETGSHAGLAAGDPWLREFAKIHRGEFPPETARGVAQTLEILDKFLAYCRQRDAHFVLLVIPRSYQVYPGELKEMQTAFGIADADLDLDHPQRVLQDWAQQRGALALDLLPEFRRDFAEHPNRKLFHYPDAHLNAAGHALVAERLAAWLGERSLPRLPQQDRAEIVR